MTKLTLKNKKGTTLVELVIYIALIGVLITLMSEVFAASMNFKQESARYQSVEEDGRYIVARMMYDTARATTVTIPALVGDTTNQLVLDVNGTNYTYSLTGSNLLLNNGTSTSELNSNMTTVTALSFSKVSATHVKMDFTLQSVDLLNGQPKVKSFSITLGQR